MDTLMGSKQFVLFGDGTNIPATDLAWAAGFIDGEGCIAVTRAQTRINKSVNFQLTLRAANTDRRAIERLHSLFKVGSIYERPVTNKKHKRKWDWIVMSRQAVYVIRMIAPFLVIKAEQAKLAIEFTEIPKVYACKHGTQIATLKRREEIWMQLKQEKGLSSHGMKRSKTYQTFTTNAI